MVEAIWRQGLLEGSQTSPLCEKCYDTSQGLWIRDVQPQVCVDGKVIFFVGDIYFEKKNAWNILSSLELSPAAVRPYQKILLGVKSLGKIHDVGLQEMGDVVEKYSETIREIANAVFCDPLYKCVVLQSLAAKRMIS